MASLRRFATRSVLLCAASLVIKWTRLQQAVQLVRHIVPFNSPVYLCIPSRYCGCCTQKAGDACKCVLQNNPTATLDVFVAQY